MTVIHDLLQKQLEHLNQCEILRDAYTFRIDGLRKPYNDQWEKNEAIIQKTETQIKLTNLNRTIAQFYQELDDNFRIYFQELEHE